MLLLAGARSLAGRSMPLASISLVTLDLRHAAAGGGDPVQVEAAQGLVVLSHLTLALEHMDLHGGLVVGGGGKGLALLHGDGGVTFDR